MTTSGRPAKKKFIFYTPSGLFAGQVIRCQNFYMPDYESNTGN
jgi:hypothetical protein